jgi:hypothetical protein
VENINMGIIQAEMSVEEQWGTLLYLGIAVADSMETSEDLLWLSMFRNASEQWQLWIEIFDEHQKRADMETITQ